MHFIIIMKSIDLKKPKSIFPKVEIIRRNNSLDKMNINLLINKESFQSEKAIENFDDIYSPIVKKVYPFIINPDNKDIENYCKKHNNVISFFCFACHTHFCIICKSEHTNHSFYSFEKEKINENDITKAEIAIREKSPLLFEDYLNKKLNVNINEAKNEILRFQSYVIDKYKKEKNNFYNIYNFVYIFKLKDLLKSDENDLLKPFFTCYSFKMFIKKLKFFYDTKKLRWLLKNLVSYIKDNPIELKYTKERRKKYKFENLDILIKNEGFNNGISTMKKIINEVKNRNDLKEKIFNFIIRAIDLYKKDSKNFENDLEGILKLIKIDFKDMVKEEAGHNQEVEKFMKSSNFSFYKENNVNNKIKDFIDNKELDSYNFFNINEYKSKIIELDISNTFIANNYNNKYEKLYYNSDYNKKYDILKLLHNIDKKIEENDIIIYSIFIHSTNTIIANNYNNTYIKIYNTSRKDISKNQSKFGGNKVNSHIEEENFIIVNNKDSNLKDNIDFIASGIPNNYNFSYSRKIRANSNENLGVKEVTIQLGNKEYEVIIEKGKYIEKGGFNQFGVGNYSQSYYLEPLKIYEPPKIYEQPKKEEPKKEEPKKVIEHSLSLTNKHKHEIYIVVMYRENDLEWMVNGWYIKKYNETLTKSFPGIKNRIVYYYAKCYECDIYWGKGDATGYIPVPPHPAFTYRDSSKIGKAEDFTRIDLSEKDYSTNL